MNYNKWYESIKEHLVNYKVNVLGIPGSGYYGKKLESHILPRGQADANYMCDISGISFKKHLGYHHLNSSQTMCVNFFVPLTQNDCKLLSTFMSKLLGDEIKVVKYEFEYTNKKLYGDTNFDFYCQDSNGHNYYFEIKYTEQGIGKQCSTDDKSDENLLKIYKKKYQANVEAEGSQLIIENPLVFMNEHYQAFRNMSCANETRKDYCFFVTMKENELTRKELEESTKYIKSDKYVKSLYWEDVVELAFELTAKIPDLLGYYIEFKNKYFL